VTANDAGPVGSLVAVDVPGEAPGSVVVAGTSVCEVVCCVCPVFELSAGGVRSNERTVTGLRDSVTCMIYDEVVY
jgi:hypothetical protein